MAQYTHGRELCLLQRISAVRPLDWQIRNASTPVRCKCCFSYEITSTETVGLLGTAMTLEGHLDFHTALELWTPVSVQMRFSFFQSRSLDSHGSQFLCQRCAQQWTLKLLKLRLKIIKQWQLIDESFVVCCCYNCYVVLGVPLLVCPAARAPGLPALLFPLAAVRLNRLWRLSVLCLCVYVVHAECVCVCVCVCVYEWVCAVKSLRLLWRYQQSLMSSICQFSASVMWYSCMRSA